MFYKVQLGSIGYEKGPRIEGDISSWKCFHKYQINTAQVKRNTTDLEDHYRIMTLLLRKLKQDGADHNFHGKALIVKKHITGWMLQVNTPGSHD